MAHRDFGYQLARRVVEDAREISAIDQAPRFLGNQLVMMLTPVKKKVDKVEEVGKSTEGKKNEQEAKNES